MIVTFYPNGCSQFENPEAPDSEKNCFRFQLLCNTFTFESASASNIFHQTAFASASKKLTASLLLTFGQSELQA